MAQHTVVVLIAVVGILNLIVALSSQATTWRLVAAMKRHDRALWEREAGLHWLFGATNGLRTSFVWRRGYLASRSHEVQTLGGQARVLLIVAAAGWVLFMVLIMAFATLDSAAHTRF